MLQRSCSLVFDFEPLAVEAVVLALVSDGRLEVEGSGDVCRGATMSLGFRRSRRSGRRTMCLLDFSGAPFGRRPVKCLAVVNEVVEGSDDFDLRVRAGCTASACVICLWSYAPLELSKKQASQ